MATRRGTRAESSKLLHFFRSGGLALAVLVGGTLVASGQTVLARARIGNNVEGMTFVGNGPLEDSIVFADGHQLRAVSAEPCSRRCGVEELLDLKTLPIVAKVNGLAYISNEKIFVLWDGGQPDHWFLLDKNAQPLPGTRAVTHLPGLGGGGGEGMVYLPPSAPRFGDRILSSTYDDNFVTHIEVFKRNGQAVAEIIPKGALDPGLETITGIGYKAPDRLLIGTVDNFLWVMDFDGNVVQGPIDASPSSDFEGVVQTAGGKIVAAPYSDGSLLFFDKRFNRLPQLDRDVRIGIGKTRPLGVAWDSDTQSVLADPSGQNFLQELDSLSPSLDSFIKIADLPGGARGITYLAGEHRIGAAHGRNPRAVLLYDNGGTQTEEVDVQDPASGNLNQVTFVPSRQQFVSLLNDSLLHYSTRNGSFVQTVDPAPLGVAAPLGLAFFPAGPGDPNPDGNLAVTDLETQRVVFMDVDATTTLGQIDYRSASTLSMVTMRPGYIDNGSLAGSFIGFDVNNSEIIIFRR